MVNAWTVFRISAAMRGNKTIYWLGRIPLVRRLVSDTLYDAAGGKLALSILINLWRAIRAVLGKFVYLGLCCVLPLLLVLDVEGLFTRQGFGLFTWLLVFLSFVAGPILRAHGVEASQLKFTCVRMMSMDAKRYQLLTGLGYHLAMFVTFTPPLMTASALFGQGVWAGLILSVELTCARLIAEWLHVLLYDKRGVLLCNKVGWLILLIVVLLCGGYIPAMANVPLAPQTVLLHPAAVVAFLLLGGVAVALLIRYPRYYQLVMDTCKPEMVSVELARQKAAGAQFADVQLKDSDLTAEGDSTRTGWPYLQALFFRRHRRMLYKPLKIVLIALGAVTVLLAAALLLFGHLAADDLADLFSYAPRCLPFCVFVLYFVDNTVGTRITKAMFYNCDLAMLKYGWYRQPDVVLKNFGLRIARLGGVNLLVSGGACVMVTVLTLCAGGRPPLGEYLVFMAALLCLGIFFAVHCLGMYYLFQPYTSDLQVKNPFFGAINWVMYMVCYLCIQIRSTPSWFALLVLVVTVVYSGVILVLVYRRAPHTFRVK